MKVHTYHILISLFGQVISNIVCYFIIALLSDGIPPDGHPVDVVSLILVPVVVFGSTLMGILLAFAIVCLCFNIIFRNRKLVNPIILAA